MKLLFKAAAAVVGVATAAQAGGIERRGDPSQILFEQGRNYLEFSAVTVHPNTSGVARPGVPTGPTGNIHGSYESYALGYKHQLNDRLALAFVIDEPVGVTVNYRTPPATLGGAFFGGSTAEVSSIAYTAMAKYDVADRFSVYGGIRFQGLQGDIRIVSPTTGFITGPGVYTLSEGRDFEFGYLLGAAYEIPEMALRLALTYESEIEHSFTDDSGTPFDVAIPQAVTLHAQTGIAPDTLLFGSVKWREWTEFAVEPVDFFSFASGAPVNASIARGTSDIWTYELGIGRRFNENWSGAATLGYEEDQGDIVGNLAGVDGFFSYGLSVKYETEDWEITSGIRYANVGSADTNVSSFSGNDAFVAGLKLGFRF